MQLRACSVLGLPRRTERATDWHRALRNLFLPWCDETDGRFTFMAESDRFSLDYMICHSILDKPFAIRFGRLNNGTIRRNGSRRQTSARSHGFLSSEFLIEGMDEPDPGELRQVTLAYSLDRDYTEGGLPAWYMDRLVIGKETPDGFDELDTVATFDAPLASVPQPVRAVYIPRASERDRWRREFREAMGNSA